MPTRAKPSRSTAKSKPTKATKVVAEKRSAQSAKRKPAKPAVHRAQHSHAPKVAPKAHAHAPVPVAAPVQAPVQHAAAHVPAATTPYQKALRFLHTLTDYERLRIVRYNVQTFDLDRMRHLLKKLGNPETQFKSIHVDRKSVV